MSSRLSDKPGIVRLDQPAQPGAVDHPRPDRLEQGNPRRETWTLYESADGQMSSGIWACEVGRWRIVFPAGKDEYFFVLEGHVRLHDRDGGFVDVQAGQGAVIPGGFEGAFEVISPVRKHFVVVERPQAG
ncbi:cupin domain-containing protein [Aquabacterium sp. NJ1]|uniref:cupin domain-containing protein n=1 Tax=Aquabacterium sp. NJ1 TaxID=1538295 RepID=UPI00068D826E|nr:cupin domain-containing protein [Aquabacterium sp. NJ1]